MSLFTQMILPAHLVLSALLALVGGLSFTPLMIRLARRMNWIAYPQSNRWHKEPTAQMGGVAIFGAAALAVLLFGPHNASWWPIYGGGTLMFAVGLLDDERGVKPATKLIAQVGATMLLLYAGYAFGEGAPYWLTIPLTFLWVIGITNAVNLIDGMDGLAAGICVITAVVLAVFGGLMGEITGQAVILAVAGAATGFLAFNFKPARIFMGDCGSLFLGYMIAAFALIIQSQISGREGLGVYLTSIAVLAVPIFDTTLVTIVRLLNGRSITDSGNDHAMHRLALLGMSEKKTVLTLYTISLAFGVLALTFHFAAVKLFYAIAIFFLVGLGVFGLHLGTVNVYDEEPNNILWNRPRTMAGKLGEVMRAFLGRGWKVTLGVVGDLLLIVAAFIMAHYLRYEEGLNLARESFLVSVLPAVVGIKLLIFALAGMYRGLWRRAGTPEIILIGKTTLFASVATYAALLIPYGSGFLSEAIFFIDWMIVTIAVTCARFGFRGLRQYLSSQRHDGKRVLLYGAGDAGALTLRRLRQNTAMRFHPVGFIDDDPTKQGLKAQGLAVLGSFDDLPRLCRKHKVEEVLITAFGMTDERKREIHATCLQIPIDCRVFEVSLRPLPSKVESKPEPAQAAQAV